MGKKKSRRYKERPNKANTLRNKLFKMGISYKQYLASEHWINLKHKFYQRHEKKCAVCGTTEDIQLHHRTYTRLGRERLDDLVPMCRHHHEDFHAVSQGQDNMKTKTKNYINRVSRGLLYGREGAKGKKVDRVLDGVGPDCARCKSETARWVHTQDFVPKKGKGYYLYWYTCENADCRTEHIMAEEAYISPEGVQATGSSKKNKKQKKKKHNIDSIQEGFGPPCSRCETETKRWIHGSDFKPAPGKGHFSYWYTCFNDDCRTGVILPPEAFIPAHNGVVKKIAPEHF